MARFVFFSFDYEDVKNFKVNVVRNSWLLSNQKETFIDNSIWESAKTKGEKAIKKLIEEGLNRTSVTAVLIGDSTADRKYVNYEIIKSFERGNGLVAVHINRIRAKTGYISSRGQNPLDRLSFTISDDGRKIFFHQLINGRWEEYADLPEINNRKSNSLHFDHHWLRGNEFGQSFRFSDKFPTMCWDFHDGHRNFTSWVESSARQAKR
jgi:hypothetical protein